MDCLNVTTRVKGMGFTAEDCTTLAGRSRPADGAGQDPGNLTVPRP